MIFGINSVVKVNIQKVTDGIKNKPGTRSE